MKKVCVVTAARSEYGLLYGLLKELKASTQLQLQLLVTGSHLSPEQGLTYQQIIEDDFYIDKTVEFLFSTSSSVGIAKSMGVCSISMADALNDLHPDLLVVLGDRYELLSICSTALVMRIPIAHISGGDITEGAIDDQIRNAITMMSTLHFPGTEDSANRIIRMIGTNHNVYVVGEPGLDNFINRVLMCRRNLADNLGLDINKKWYLVTLHPETKETLSYNLLLAHNIIETLKEIQNIQVIITHANMDLGGVDINTYFKEAIQTDTDKFKLYSSLGQLRYLSLMKEVDCVIGNSSSGIVEAPFLGKPVLNIGKRQLGRHLCNNVFTISGLENTIKDTLSNISGKDTKPDYYYGDGMASKRISTYIHKYLE
mgnify:CR=1 FL=1|jgi:UDP-N-acetyl-D-glucosamine 2-epimerase, UDP-hydrolysing